MNAVEKTLFRDPVHLTPAGNEALAEIIGASLAQFDFRGKSKETKK